MINDDGIDRDRRFLKKREKFDKKTNVIERASERMLNTLFGYLIRTGLTEPRSVSELREM
jgi:hypothetical protein